MVRIVSIKYYPDLSPTNIKRMVVCVRAYTHAYMYRGEEIV